MALRAGYYGVKRFLRDKLETIAGTYDDTIKSLFPRSEQAVLGAHNINCSKFSSSTVNGVVFTVASDIEISAVNTETLASNAQLAGSSFVAPFSAQLRLSGGIDDNHHVYPWDFTTNSRPYTDSSKTRLQSENAGANSIEFWMEKGHSYNLTLRVYAGTTASNVTFHPLLTLANDTSDIVTPYAMTNKELTDSVADQKTAINAIITAATGSADFAAFKAAMEAITPVTRSLSLTKKDITEEVKEVEPEKTVTKKRTTKKTEGGVNNGNNKPD